MLCDGFRKSSNSIHGAGSFLYKLFDDSFYALEEDEPQILIYTFDAKHNQFFSLCVPESRATKHVNEYSSVSICLCQHIFVGPL